MRIRILFFAQLREVFGSSYLVDLPAGSTIEEVYDLLAGKPEWPYGRSAPLVFAVNEHFEAMGTTLQNNDDLAVMTPLSGG